MKFLMPLALLGLLALLACDQKPDPAADPAGKQGAAPTGEVVLGGSGEPLPYPDDLLQYLSSALDKPTEGYPALANTWSVIASLPWPQPAAEGSAQAALSAQIDKAATDGLAAGNPPPELLAAWLAINPPKGEAAIAAALQKQEWKQLRALRFNEAVGRRLLRSADANNMNTEGASISLDLLREWGRVEESDRPWLSLLLKKGEPNVEMRAAGWLLMLENQTAQAADPAAVADSETAKACRDKLGQIVREKSRHLEYMAAACEGIRISADPKMADALVNIAARALDSEPGVVPEDEKDKAAPHGHIGTSPAPDTKPSPHGDMGGGAADSPHETASGDAAQADKKETDKKETDKTEAGKKGADKKSAKAEKPADSKSEQTPFDLLYGTYALTYLPGEQAALLRQKLIAAKDPNVAWQARLGELLHGNPEPWNSALKKEGFSHQLWIALETRAAVSPELLATYEQAASSDEASQRLDTARQLERFATLSPEQLAGLAPRLVAIFELLSQDSLDAVRQLAFFSAAELRPAALGPIARRVASDTSATPVLRLSACYATLALLAHGIDVPEQAPAEDPAQTDETKSPSAESSGAEGQG